MFPLVSQTPFLRRSCTTIGAFGALGLLSGANQALAAEPTAMSAAAPVSVIPSAPTVPASLYFEQELAGRRALFAVRDACRTAPTLRFAATWQIATRNGGADDKVTSYSGTESLAVDTRARRLNLATETLANNGKTVRRAISNGDTLLVTRFEQKGPKTAPTREVFRLPFGPDDPLATTLYQAQVTPITHAAGWLFDTGWTVKGRTWRDSKPAGGVGVAAHAVYEAEAPTGDAQNGRGRTARTRRYVIADKTGLPLVFEEWTVVRGPARREGEDGSRITYRRENYASMQTGARTLPATLWAQATPAGYAEKTPPDVPLPGGDTRGPKDADPQALALLAKWTRAHERMLSYTADVSLSVQQTAKTPDAPPLPVEWRDQSISYTVWVKRPGEARLTLNAVNAAAARQAAAMGQRQNGGGRRQNQQARYNQSLLAVATGDTASVLDRTARQGRSVALDDPANLGARLIQAGWNDWAGTLNWLLIGPRSIYQTADRVTYLGKSDVDGEPVEAVRIESEQDNNGRRRQRGAGAGGVQITTTVTVYLGADGLPRATETYRTTSIEGSFERDEPPNLSLVARYRDARADVPPPSGVFAFTSQDAALIRPRGR